MTAYRGIIRSLSEEPVNTTRYTTARRLPICSDEVFLDSSPQVYFVTDVLSSIYITSSIISMEQNLFSLHRKSRNNNIYLLDKAAATPYTLYYPIRKRRLTVFFRPPPPCLCNLRRSKPSSRREKHAQSRSSSAMVSVVF